MRFGEEALQTTFAAMGSSVHLVCLDAERLTATAAMEQVWVLEGLWSRFEEHSDISAVNNAHGHPVRVHPDTFTLLAAMDEARHATGGAYDPARLVEVCDLGYDRSWRDDSKRCRHDRIGTGFEVTTDPEALTVQRIGAPIDPGGIGKGLAADLVASRLVAEGLCASAMLNIGGDLAVAGPAPQAGWEVRVADPSDRSRNVATMRFRAGGVATSAARSVTLAGGASHQLGIGSAEPGYDEVASVSVAAPAGWLAEAHATAAITAGGTNAAADYMNLRGLDGVIVETDGAVTLINGRRGVTGSTDRTAAPDSPLVVAAQATGAVT